MSKSKIFGLLICAITALSSMQISNYIGIVLLNLEKSPISPIIIAILIGSILSNTVKNIDKYNSGFTFAIKYLLKLGIVSILISQLIDFEIIFTFKNAKSIFPKLVYTR